MNTPTVTAAHCPVCQRYIGPAGECPYCGENAERPPALRLLRIAALLLTAAGLLFLYLMARAAEAPATAIGSITPRMNYGIVRVAGTIVRRPYVSRRGDRVDYLSFLLDDGTGALRVQASDEVAAAIAARPVGPARNRRAEVTGKLRITGDGQCKLRILSANHLVCEPRAAERGPS